MSRKSGMLREAAELVSKAGSFRRAGFIGVAGATIAGGQALRKTGQGEYKKGMIYGGAAAGLGMGAGAMFRGAGSRMDEARRLAAKAGTLGGFGLKKKAIMGLGIAAGAAAGGYGMYKHGTSVFAGQ